MTTLLQNTVTHPYPQHARASVAEFFVMYSKLSADLKEQAMREYLVQNSLALISVRCVIEALFHPEVVFDLAKGTPPFKSTPHADRTPSSFGKRCRSFHYFIKGANGFMENPVRRTNMFIQFLESMSTPDAMLTVLIKDKDWENVGITPEEAHRFFPEWLPALPPMMVAPVSIPTVQETPAQPPQTPSVPEAPQATEQVSVAKKKPGPKPKPKVSIPNE